MFLWWCAETEHTHGGQKNCVVVFIALLNIPNADPKKQTLKTANCYHQCWASVKFICNTKTRLIRILKPSVVVLLKQFCGLRFCFSSLFNCFSFNAFLRVLVLFWLINIEFSIRIQSSIIVEIFLPVFSTNFFETCFSQFMVLHIFFFLKLRSLNFGFYTRPHSKYIKILIFEVFSF